MQTLILTLHIIVCVVLVILILLQAGKEGMGVIFGGGNTSVFGSSGAGGMLTKISAAKRATAAGADMIITNGARADVLYDIVEGKPVGTRFIGKKEHAQ